ncbi:Pentatricopeptide repeat-containing protein [Camellia lanceoleosa]|uniref:Pentatricopeptide repeat-containing protein n=1 Tax=Camellia lanceoleosa TaxID=1840588 RepID=A0ACC0J316_9ERIC|nr:Pentatricopeptide repeat-containing protein [Camellia lanceoleosa]
MPEVPNFNQSDNNLLLQSVGSSSSCSPSSASVFTNLNPSQEQYFLPPKPTISSVLNPISNNPLDYSFDLGCETGFLQTHSLTSLNRGELFRKNKLVWAVDVHRIWAGGACTAISIWLNNMYAMFKNGEDLPQLATVVVVNRKSEEFGYDGYEF